jgi:hypothetical protein
VGESLYLSPYIESGDIETGQRLAEVVDPLPGIEGQERTRREKRQILSCKFKYLIDFMNAGARFTNFKEFFLI